MKNITRVMKVTVLVKNEGKENESYEIVSDLPIGMYGNLKLADGTLREMYVKFSMPTCDFIKAASYNILPGAPVLVGGDDIEDK